MPNEDQPLSECDAAREALHQQVRQKAEELEVLTQRLAALDRLLDKVKRPIAPVTPTETSKD